MKERSIGDRQTTYQSRAACYEIHQKARKACLERDLSQGSNEFNCQRQCALAFGKLRAQSSFFVLSRFSATTSSSHQLCLLSLTHFCNLLSATTLPYSVTPRCIIGISDLDFLVHSYNAELLPSCASACSRNTTFNHKQKCFLPYKDIRYT